MFGAQRESVTSLDADHCLANVQHCPFGQPIVKTAQVGQVVLFWPPLNAQRVSRLQESTGHYRMLSLQIVGS